MVFRCSEVGKSSQLSRPLLLLLLNVPVLFLAGMVDLVRRAMSVVVSACAAVNQRPLAQTGTGDYV